MKLFYRKKLEHWRKAHNPFYGFACSFLHFLFFFYEKVKKNNDFKVKTSMFQINNVFGQIYNKYVFENNLSNFMRCFFMTRSVL